MCFYLCVCLCLCVSFFSVSAPASVSMSISMSVSVFMSMSMSTSVSVSVSVSVCVCICVYVCICLCVCFCVCVFVCVPPRRNKVQMRQSVSEGLNYKYFFKTKKTFLKRPCLRSIKLVFFYKRVWFYFVIESHCGNPMNETVFLQGVETYISLHVIFCQRPLEVGKRGHPMGLRHTLASIEGYLNCQVSFAHKPYS